MNGNKSFWVWFAGGIGTGLKELYDWVYKYWQGILIGGGPVITLYSLLNAWWYYRPTWVDTDYITTGSFGYYAAPKLMPWMILWPAAGIAMFMTGLYGHWREEVKE